MKRPVTKKMYLFIIIYALSQLSASGNNSNPRYLFQPRTPIAVGNFLYPEDGCNWLGIVGQVFNKGEPTENLIVKINGSLGGEDILVYSITGGAPRLGSGGYEVYLSDSVISSENTLFIQLIGMYGMPLSPNMPFSTYNDCSRNSIIVNFIDVTVDNDIFLPEIRR